MGWQVATLRRAPFSVAVVGVLWTVGIVTGSVRNGPSDLLIERMGVGVPALAQGRWWTPLTSMFWCADLTGYLLTTVVVLAMGLLAERRLGTARTAVTFLACNVVGGCAGSAVIAAGSLIGEWWSISLDDSLVVGATPGAAGVLLALSYRCSLLWRRRLRLLVLIFLGMLVLYSGQLQDVIRLTGGLVGLLGTGLLAGPATSRRATMPSRPEARLLLALITCASAVGPLIAAVSGTEVGPLSSLRYVFLPGVPSPSDVAEACSDATQLIACHDLRTQVEMHGLGPAFTAIIPVLLLLVLAEGLRRGRRFALWAVVVVNVLLTVFGLVSLGVVPGLVSTILLHHQSYTDLEVLLGVLVATLQPLVVVALLLRHRRAFDLRAAPDAYRRMGTTVAMILLVLSVGYVVGGSLVSGQFEPAPGPGELLADLPWRFVPPGYINQPGLQLLPVGPVALLLYGWTGAIAWTGLLAGAWTTFWGSRDRAGATDAGRARGLLVEHGGSQLSYMTTWHGSSYWFTPDGRCVVAYRLACSVALTVGDPVGDPDAFGDAVQGFAEFCAANGWTPCFYSITEENSTALARTGWKLLQVGEDTMIPLAELEFTGRRWQDVRTAMNRARREGMTAQWHDFRHGPQAITNQIRSISAQWVLDKGLPEMGFTLGGLRELRDAEVRCLIAIDENQTVHAVTSWLPIYSGGAVVGRTLDMMRRRRTATNGVMEFLVASAALQFKAEGSTVLSLSGAPLARHDRGPKVGGLAQLLDTVARACEPVYGFGSLLAFKAKFQPTYRPLFLAYPDSAALPSIGLAIARAYLPDLTLRQIVRLGALALSRRTGGAARRDKVVPTW